ncbi:response regulator transcription factor [Halobacteriovorax sp. GB3]|uniref:response regulator transcription factor n=1 Tax=Halobacteriovorax sp. GB3 TaxID=2719615 RepID=UPI002360ADDB|nr:response regulator transcription factor [Halobacteriovorax sp. GB3]MDD0852960.1 response regulator transcription factor [Halobacteriovorax sp. GB3]
MLKSKILVVDDNEDIRILVKKILDPSYLVETVSTAEECLEKAWEYKPNLIILDIMLEDASGYELCSQLKSNDDLKHTPVIFLSAKTGSNSRITGYKLGAVHYLEKPFEPEELREIVNTVLKNLKIDSQLEVVDYNDITLNIPSQEVSIRGDKIHFTSSEFKIIHLLLKNAQRVLSREKILNHIAPGNERVNDRMIDTYISSIRRKIKQSSFAIKSVYGEGYKIVTL